MLLDEPYRWAETVANRREYLEDQLRGGSPAVGIPYDDGALLLTFGRGGRKLFEVYDRVAFAAMGHPADIERLRIAAVDMAHVDGFTNSVADVSLQRLVNFGIAPLVKNAFDEVFRAPYIIRVLMAEIGPAEGARFYTVDCDGAFESAERCGAVAGTEKAAGAMRAYLASRTGGGGLAEALDVALRAWALGRKVSRAEEEGKEVPESPQVEDREVGEILREEMRTRDAETAVLARSRLSKSKFHALTGEEVRAAVSEIRNLESAMRNRIFGLETEYGCLAPDREGFISPDSISMKVKNHIFHTDRCGIVDIHYRGRDEPPGNGGFLFNAGRVYIDMGHIEYTTPECTGLFDVVAFDKAGERIFQSALRQLGLGGEAAFFKNNIDHFTGATFGCHENYLIRRNVPFSTLVIPALLPFLVTRQIFCGAGRVGSYDDSFYYYSRDEREERERQDPISFQISQRADHIVTETYQWIQFSRAIINTRDEPLADHSKYRRLHLLVGDSNMSEYATALKVGTTAIVLSLIERKVFPRDVLLKDSVWALKQISRDPEFSWIVERHSGGTISAVDVQRRYLELAQRHLDDRDEDVEWVLKAWESTLDDLERDPMSLTDRIDWVAKKYLLETFMEAEDLSWDDPWLQSLDLEYHNIDIDRGLYYDLERRGAMRRTLTDKQIDRAMVTPPQDTRARARAEVVKKLTEHQIKYIVDWDQVYLENERSLNLRDPFETYEQETTAFIADISPFSLPWVRKERQ